MGVGADAYSHFYLGGLMHMARDGLSAVFTLTLSEQEKRLLARLAYERGATMSGFVRKLIRDAARTTQQSANTTVRESDPDER
jgi:hypothetical protein